MVSSWWITGADWSHIWKVSTSSRHWRNFGVLGDPEDWLQLGKLQLHIICGEYVYIYIFASCKSLSGSKERGLCEQYVGYGYFFFFSHVVKSCWSPKPDCKRLQVAGRRFYLLKNRACLCLDMNYMKSEINLIVWAIYGNLYILASYFLHQPAKWDWIDFVSW